MWLRAAPYLQHGHLLSVAKQSERQGVSGVQARDHVTAAERNRNDVGLEIGPVLVEDELVILDSAPALPPAAVGQHVEIACEGTDGTRSVRGNQPPRPMAWPLPSASFAGSSSGRQPTPEAPELRSLRTLLDG